MSDSMCFQPKCHVNCPHECDWKIGRVPEKKKFDMKKIDAMIEEWQYWRTHNYTWPEEVKEEKKEDDMVRSILFTDKCPDPPQFHKSTKIFLKDNYFPMA